MLGSLLNPTKRKLNFDVDVGPFLNIYEKEHLGYVDIPFLPKHYLKEAHGNGEVG